MRHYLHLNGHVLAGVDVETTGRVPGFHEIIQIGVQPLDPYLNPMEDVSPFYHNIKPEYPERAESKATAVHGLDIDHLVNYAPDKWTVADWLDDWVTKIEKPIGKCLAPLAHNWQYEAGFLKDWLGIESFNAFFHWSARDTMLTAMYLNDRAHRKGNKIPYSHVGLTYLCKEMGVVNENPHDALADARAEAQIYRHMLEHNYE